MSSMEKDKEGETAYKAPRLALSIKDFDIVGRIEDGSFSTVALARLIETKVLYAIKIICKTHIIRNKMTTYIRNERNILDKLDYDGVAKLCFTFQDLDNLYMGLEHCEGGELYYQICKHAPMPLENVRFYAAEIVLILEYLRANQVIHRDLKPENLLLSSSGHLKLIDFGSARALFLPPSEATEKYFALYGMNPVPPTGGDREKDRKREKEEEEDDEETADWVVTDGAAQVRKGEEGKEGEEGSEEEKTKCETKQEKDISASSSISTFPPSPPQNGPIQRKRHGWGSETVSVDVSSSMIPLPPPPSSSSCASSSAPPTPAPPPQRLGRACSFVGTAEYVAPEVLNNVPVSFATDLWALGCLVFQMLTGTPPFKGKSEYLTFQLVAEGRFEFPNEGFPETARDLVDRLLQVDAEQRIGARDLSELRRHPFFDGVDWATLRSSPAPEFTRPPAPSPTEEALDWELASLVRTGDGAVYYESTEAK